MLAYKMRSGSSKFTKKADKLEQYLKVKDDESETEEATIIVTAVDAVLAIDN